jgi:hypothetical protein
MRDRDGKDIFGQYCRIGNAAFSCFTRAGGGARTPFLVAIVLDCIYQLVTVQFVYPLLDISTCETDLAD